MGFIVYALFISYPFSFGGISHGPEVYACCLLYGVYHGYALKGRAQIYLKEKTCLFRSVLTYGAFLFDPVKRSLGGSFFYGTFIVVVPSTSFATWRNIFSVSSIMPL